MFSKSDLCKGEGNCVNKGEEHDQHAVRSGGERWCLRLALSERDLTGLAVGWGGVETQPWKTQPGGRRMRFIYYYLYFLLSTPSKLRKAAVLRHAETISEGTGGESAQGEPTDCGVPAEPQRRRWVPPSILSQPGSFGGRNLTSGLSAISVPPAQPGAKSCRLLQVPSVGLSLSVTTKKRKFIQVFTKSLISSRHL